MSDHAAPDPTGLREAVESLVTGPTVDAWRNEAARGRAELPYASNRYVRLVDDLRALLAAHPDLTPEPDCRKCGEPAAHHGKHNECVYMPEPDAGDVSDHAALTEAEAARLALVDWIIDNRWGYEAYDFSHALMASDWLAARVAEAVERERAARLAALLTAEDTKALAERDGRTARQATGLREALNDIRDRRREFQRLGADPQYLMALDDAFGLVNNRLAARTDPRPEQAVS